MMTWSLIVHEGKVKHFFSFSHLGLPGEIYMRLLKMTILPLVISTIITGLTIKSTMCSG